MAKISWLCIIVSALECFKARSVWFASLDKDTMGDSVLQPARSPPALCCQLGPSVILLKDGFPPCSADTKSRRAPKLQVNAERGDVRGSLTAENQVQTTNVRGGPASPWLSFSPGMRFENRCSTLSWDLKLNWSPVALRGCLLSPTCVLL